MTEVAEPVERIIEAMLSLAIARCHTLGVPPALFARAINAVTPVARDMVEQIELAWRWLGVAKDDSGTWTWQPVGGPRARTEVREDGGMG